jgi:hypothetical protein
MKIVVGPPPRALGGPFDQFIDDFLVDEFHQLVGMGGAGMIARRSQ